MKQLLSVFFVLFALPVFAQQIVADDITISQTADKAAWRLEWVVGETVCENVTGANGITLVQGSLRPQFTVTFVEKPLWLKNVSVFPNPATDVLNISVSTDAFDGDVTVHTLDGKLISSHKLSGNLLQINVAHLADASYMVRVTNTDQSAATFTINKVQ